MIMFVQWFHVKYRCSLKSESVLYHTILLLVQYLSIISVLLYYVLVLSFLNIPWRSKNRACGAIVPVIIITVSSYLPCLWFFITGSCHHHWLSSTNIIIQSTRSLTILTIVHKVALIGGVCVCLCMCLHTCVCVCCMNSPHGFVGSLFHGAPWTILYVGEALNHHTVVVAHGYCLSIHAQ